MEGILVVAHGSRAKETEQTLVNILDMVRNKLPDTAIEHSFMEFSDKSIDKGIAALAAKGVTEIKVVPYFLFMGIHMQEDIPETIAECIKEYPGMTATISDPLGVDPRLADILVERIKG